MRETGADVKQWQMLEDGECLWWWLFSFKGNPWAAIADINLFYNMSSFPLCHALGFIVNDFYYLHKIVRQHFLFFLQKYKVDSFFKYILK